MNLYCSGQGATTVVFDAPSGDAGWSWFRVQPIRGRQRVVADAGHVVQADKPEAVADAVLEILKP